MSKKGDDYKGIYSEMVDILDEETVIEIYKNYKGQQITFPMKLYSRAYIEKYITENYKKKDVREIAKDLGYSTKWVRNLISELKKNK